MPRVLITTEALRHAEWRHADLLHEAGFEIAYPLNPQLPRGLSTEEETISELREADAVIAGGENLSATVLAALPRLRVIARTGVGYDRIDVPAATHHRVAVTITPTANHAAVAEHALALLLAISKNVVATDRQTRTGLWPRDLIEPVRGKTIGIFGLGRIGRTMAIRSAALGMSVIAHDPFPDESFARQHHIELVDFETLVSHCDVLTIHCPLLESTHRIINRDVFARMKPTAYLINTARGPIVNEADLVSALRAGQIRGAGLDVFEEEPPPQDNPLFSMDNVVMTPHTAGLDALATRDMAIEAAECVVKLYRHDWPDGAVVNDELKTHWQWNREGSA